MCDSKTNSSLRKDTLLGISSDYQYHSNLYFSWAEVILSLVVVFTPTTYLRVARQQISGYLVGKISVKHVLNIRPLFEHATSAELVCNTSPIAGLFET